MPRLAAALLLLLLGTSAGAAVYRWVDEAGNVHFGDCPPPECPSEEIRPGPPNIVPAMPVVPEAVPAPVQPAPDTPAVPERAAREPPSCYDRPEAFLGSGFSDFSRPLRPRTLTGEERADLDGLLRGLEGRWSGRMEDRLCLGSEGEPEEAIDRFRVEMDLERGRDGVWRFEYHLDGIDNRTRDSGLFWLFHDGAGLNWGERDPNNPAGAQWAVEVLEVEPGAIGFVRSARRRTARGGSVHRLDYHELRQVEGDLALREYIYFQGYLSGTRYWVLERRFR